MRSNKRSLFQLSLSVFLFTLIVICSTGCTEVHTMPVKAMVFAQGAGEHKIPLNVILLLDKKWLNYTYSYQWGAGRHEYPLGKVLENYAKSVTQQTFQSVTREVDATATDGKAVVTLEPRIAKADEVFAGLSAWAKRKVVFQVEWTMRDANSKKIVWLATIDGQAEYPIGTLLSMNSNERKLYQMLFDDLSLKTVKAFKDAPEIRSLIK
ncbi:MAG: hypothetical protein HY301_07205 [Verrucomicrobia bacterium]|nr:hypothetical protein [Verrucomicrobiota bacterium]